MGRKQHTPTPEAPEAPEHLSDRQKAIWRHHVTAYRFEAPQLELLRRLCEAGDTADQAREVLAREGLTIVDRFGQARPHPCVAIERDARVAVARLTRELRFPEAKAG